MRKKNLWNRGVGLLVMLPLAFSLAACDSGSNGGRDRYEADEETPTPTEKPEETPTETPTPEPDIEHTPVEKIDYEEVYAPVLEENLSAIRDGYDFDMNYQYISTGIMERIMYGEKDELLVNIGYMIADISGDGIPELLIGENAADGVNSGESAYIYDAYTCVDGKPVTVFEGWVRNSQRWMGNGWFFNFGSGGAMYNIFGQFHLSTDGTVVIWDDYFFTADENGELVLYHNTAGVSDPGISEQIDMTDDEITELINSYETKTLTFKPIGSYKGSAAAQSSGNQHVSTAEEPIVGVWGLRSYANMDIKDYIVFEDGTWLAVESMPSYTVDGSFTKATGLCGTWEEGRGGSAGFYAYNLLDENGDLYEPVLVHEDDMGNMVMNFTGNLEFYYSDFYVPDEIVGSWVTPKGTEIIFDDAYNWEYRDDEGNWILGGHCVIDTVPEGEYLRLHTMAGDTGNYIFAEGKFYEDNTGYDVIDMKYYPMFKDIAGTGSTYSKSY